MTERSKLDSHRRAHRRRITPRHPRHRAAFVALAVALAAVALAGCATAGGGSPSGSEEKPDEASQQVDGGGRRQGERERSSGRARGSATTICS